MKRLTDSAKLLHHLLFIFLFLLHTGKHPQVKATAPQELLQGFSASPDSSTTLFQSLLEDPTGNFSLGFLRVDQSQLALAILHLPSSEPFWVANTTTSVKWSKHTQLFFNGSLLLYDTHKRIVWSTQSNGDRLLLDNSNLQIQSNSRSHSVLWQSFDFPSNTLVENQNFTSDMSLVSSNGEFFMRLGEDYIGLYTKSSNQIYWKHRAMQAKAEIVKGKGPIYAQISSNGFLGMYQTGTEPPADVLPFDTFQRTISGIRRLKLEQNGNLKAYYWNGSAWRTDYTAITKECELPNSCGAYGLCKPGNGCQCLNNETECFSETNTNNLCTENESFWVLRRPGVELPYKELIAFQKMKSLEECEASCEKNCSCWGATFNNASGYCYKIDYPIGSLVSVGDESRVGYFKVRRVVEKKRRNLGYVIGVGLLVGAFVILAGVVGVGLVKIWRRRKNRVNMNRLVDDGGVSPGAYRDLGSASFRSIEMCKS